MKKCIKCRTLKSRFREGRNTCRECESLIAGMWAKKNSKRKQIGNRKYLETALGKAALRRKTNNFRDKYPEKYKAYTVVQTAVRNGTLKKCPCIVCNNLEAQAHHSDYSKPLQLNGFALFVTRSIIKP